MIDESAGIEETEKEDDGYHAIYLDKKFFVKPYSYGWRLGWLHVTEDMREVERSAGFYGRLDQALVAYADHCLKHGAAHNIQEVIDLIKQTHAIIEKVSIAQFNRADAPNCVETRKIEEAKKKRSRKKKPVFQ